MMRTKSFKRSRGQRPGLQGSQELALQTGTIGKAPMPQLVA